jgi:phosphoenolpyruvate---glycerone phosphotransferase subunit DhaL
MVGEELRGAPALPMTHKPGSSFTVGDLVLWIARYGELIARDVEVLTELDAAIGDADHGVNMSRGMVAVTDFLREAGGDSVTFNSLCQGIGRSLVSAAGGAAGMLYGIFFIRFGAAAGDAGAISPEQFSAALDAGLQGVMARGRAAPGDKTMVDAMTPAIRAIARTIADEGWDSASATAVGAARDGCDRVTPLVARKGRASYLGSRSAGHADPGAASTLLLFEALRDVLEPVSRP